MITETILLVLSSAFFVGMSIKQASYILIRGSIFESLRKNISKRAEGSWFWGKMNELFSCHLCMTTQVSIWTVGAAFATSSIGGNWPVRYGLTSSLLVSVALSLLAAFLASMAYGGIAFWIWNFAEYRPEKFHAQTRHYEALLAKQMQALRAAIRENQLGNRVSLAEVAPSLEEFRGMVEQLDEECSYIGCPLGRMECRRDEGRSIFERWWAKNWPTASETHREIVLQKVTSGFRSYFSGREKNEDQLESFVTQIFEGIRAELAEF